MNYEYKSVAFNATVFVNSTDNYYDNVVSIYDDIINQHAQNGWEFYTIDDIQMHRAKGCFSEPELTNLKVAIFRRKIN